MRTTVRFDSAGTTLVGHLYTPDDTASCLRSAIVVGHPASAVKEQAAGLYARRLAEQGFITLAFDAAHQGESEGLPRGLEDPAHRIEDIKAAVSFLSIRDEVDPDRIGALGICASGGYVIPAAATDHRIKAVATVSATDIGRLFREGPDGTQDPAVIQAMLDAAATARTAEARGEAPASVPIFPDTRQQARSGGQHAYEGWEYYRTDRAQHPRSATTFTWNSIDRIAAFDPFTVIHLIAPRPLLMIVGTDALTARMTADAFEAAHEPKQLRWIDSASHVDLYDMDQYVNPAVATLTEFFQAELGLAGPAEVAQLARA